MMNSRNFSRLAFTCLCLTLLIVGVSGFCSPVAVAQTPKKLLVVTVTKGFRHTEAIDTGQPIVQSLGEKSKVFTVDYARTEEELAQKMSVAGLQQYDGVMFLNTTGDLPLPDRDAFLKWIENGNAFIGVHSATDTYHNYPPYLKMIGGEFLTHGPQLKVALRVADRRHPATAGFKNGFEVFDEIYQMKNFDASGVHALLYLTQKPVKDGMPGYYPVAWCKRYGQGRVFYTSLGHRGDVWKSEWYQAHLLSGIEYALGTKKGDDQLPKK